MFSSQTENKDSIITTEKHIMTSRTDSVKTNQKMGTYDMIDIFGMYKENWALVKSDHAYGFIDTAGNEVVPTIYHNIDFFSMNRENWAMVKQYNYYGFIDTMGKQVVPLVYKMIDLYGIYIKIGLW